MLALRRMGGGWWQGQPGRHFLAPRACVFSVSEDRASLVVTKDWPTRDKLEHTHRACLIGQNQNGEKINFKVGDGKFAKKGFGRPQRWNN